MMSACDAANASFATADGQYDEFLLRVSEGIEGGATTFNQVFYHAVQTDTQAEQPQSADVGSVGNDLTILIKR